MMTDHLTETALHTTEILARAGGHVTAGQGTDFIITDQFTPKFGCQFSKHK